MPTILTIGYSQDTFEPFEERLSAHQVEVLVDVRSAPYSKYQTDFRYGVIEALCLQSGLRYIYMGDKLGGKPTDPDLITDGRADYEKIAATPGFVEGLDTVITLAGDHTVCLMCGCEKPMRCHRGVLLAPHLIALGADIKHIDRHGVAVSHEDAEFEESGGQMSLF
jgi:uncharacterized protein (DUF488 family)